MLPCIDRALTEAATKSWALPLSHSVHVLFKVPCSVRSDSPPLFAASTKECQETSNVRSPGETVVCQREAQQEVYGYRELQHSDTAASSGKV